MFKNILIGALFGVFVIYYATDTNYKAKYNNEVEKVNNLKDTIVKLDSAYKQKQYKIDSLNDSIDILSSNIDELEHERNIIYSKYNSLREGLDSVSIDSLAKYIISNFKGNNFKINKFEDKGILIAFSDTTVRDIVSKDLDRKELKEENESLNNTINRQSSLISLQYRSIGLCNDQKDIQAEQIENLKEINTIYEGDIEALQAEAERLHKRIRVITYISATGVAVAVALVII